MTQQEERLKKLERFADVMSRIFYYGDFNAETAAEKEAETLLTELGYWPTTEDDIIRRNTPINHPTDTP